MEWFATIFATAPLLLTIKELKFSLSSPQLKNTNPNDKIKIINSPYAKEKNSVVWKYGKRYIRFIQRLSAVQ